MTVIFGTPEALTQAKWMDILQEKYEKKVCVVAFDESHCISEW